MLFWGNKNSSVQKIRWPDVLKHCCLTPKSHHQMTTAPVFNEFVNKTKTKSIPIFNQVLLILIRTSSCRQNLFERVLIWDVQIEMSCNCYSCIEPQFVRHELIYKKRRKLPEGRKEKRNVNSNSNSSPNPKHKQSLTRTHQINITFTTQNVLSAFFFLLFCACDSIYMMRSKCV